MRFTPLAGGETDSALLNEEYKAAREIGKLRLGAERLYFRAGLKTWFIPYSQIRRYFRRVMQIPAKLCCGKGNFDIESLVLCGDEGELAQIQLPGTKAAKIVMEQLKTLAPGAIPRAPEKDAAKAPETAEK